MPAAQTLAVWGSMLTRSTQLPTKTPGDYLSDIGMSSLSIRFTGNAVPDRLS
jgi:hypothetical protein